MNDFNVIEIFKMNFMKTICLFKIILNYFNSNFISKPI